MHMILAGDLIYKAFLTERNVLKYNKNSYDNDDDYADDGNDNDGDDDEDDDGDEDADDDNSVIYESSNLMNQSINFASKTCTVEDAFVLVWLGCVLVTSLYDGFIYDYSRLIQWLWE